MKHARILFTIIAACAAVLSAADAAAAVPPEARLLIVYPQDAVKDETFMKEARACESFTKEYFGSAVEAVTVTLPTVTQDAVFAAAEGKG